jgi:hypothetical protein
MVLVKRFCMTILIGSALLCWSCAPARIVEIPAKTPTHQYSYGQPRPLGEGKGRYYVNMGYDPQRGILRIAFLDKDENPVKLLREDRIKASFTGPDGKVREFSFWYPQPPLWYVSSYRVVGMRQPPVNHYSLQEDWLRGLSSFDLKVWIPLGNTTYKVEFVYP